MIASRPDTHRLELQFDERAIVIAVYSLGQAKEEQETGVLFIVRLLIDKPTPEPLLTENMPQQGAEAQLRPCLAGHRIAFGEVHQRNAQLFHQPVLEVLGRHTFVFDEDLAFGSGLAPAPLDPEALVTDADHGGRRFVLLC